MAIKDQATLLSDIDTLFATNSVGGISAEDLRTFLTDLVDTAEDRWGPGVLADSPTASPQISEAIARIQGLLADCPGASGPVTTPPGSPIIWLNPADASKMWQDLAKTTPVAADGDPIAVWEDSAGVTGDWTQSDSARRPVWRETYVQFTEDWLIGPDLSGYSNEGTLCARVQVVDTTNVGGSGGGLFHFTSMNNSQSAAHYDTSVSTTGGSNFAHFMSNARPIVVTWNSLPQPGDSTTEHTYTMQKDNPNTRLIVRVNGVDESDISTVAANNMGSAPLIGAVRRASNVSSWAIRDAYIRDGGILVYSSRLTGSALTDAEEFVEDTSGFTDPGSAAGGCISPADLRGAVAPVIDLFYPKDP